MNAIVIYKSKYGSTRDYAKWIADELECEAVESKLVNADNLEKYDTIIYGGGLYASVINGVSLITKNFEKIKSKNIIVFTTALAPLSCTDYYHSVTNKNFNSEQQEHIKIFNLLGKMIMEELTFAHRNAINMLKKFLESKSSLTGDQQILLELCGKSSDLTDRTAIVPLVEYVHKISQQTDNLKKAL